MEISVHHFSVCFILWYKRFSRADSVHIDIALFNFCALVNTCIVKIHAFSF